MVEHLHELPEMERGPSSLDVIAEVLTRMDNLGFASPAERAKQFDMMIRARGFQVLEARPMPQERAIR